MGKKWERGGNRGRVREIEKEVPLCWLRERERERRQYGYMFSSKEVVNEKLSMGLS